MKKKKLNHLILESGSVTGHKHQIKQGDATLFSTEKESENILVVNSGIVDVVHEEHKTITIPIGEYIVRNVVEKDHLKDEIRDVID